MQKAFPRRAPMRRAFATAASSSGSYQFPRHKNPTHWEVLNVPEGASVKDVKLAYYQLVKTLHPDAQTKEDGHPIKIKDRFHALQTAYETLGNETKRTAYINNRNYYRAGPSTDFSRHPRRDPGYNSQSHGSWTTWEGRYDNPNFRPPYNANPSDPRGPYNPYNPFYAPPPPRGAPRQGFYNPEKDRYPAWGGIFQSMNNASSHRTEGRAPQPPLDWKAVQKERVLGVLVLWMVFGLLLSSNSVSSHENQLRDSHNAAVRSLRMAEEQARHRNGGGGGERGDWRPAVEQRLARFRDRTDEARAQDERDGIVRTEQEMRDIAKRERAREREDWKAEEEAGTAGWGGRYEGGVGPLEAEMIRRRDWARKYPRGFVGPKEEWGQEFEIKRGIGEGGRGGMKRPMTKRERREQLREQGVREPVNPGRGLMGDGSSRVGMPASAEAM